MPSRKKDAADVAVVRPAQPRTGYQAVAGATERRLGGAMEVPIDQVVVDPDNAQPRRDWQHEDVEVRLGYLAESIREFGILQPLIVRESGTDLMGRQRYLIIAGERRRRAAERAGLRMLPVVVHGAEPARVRVLQLIENLQRQDLSPMDEARAFQELMDYEHLTPPGLALRLYVSAQHVRDRLRLLADQVLADAVERRQISATAARDIRQLPDEEMLELRARVLAGDRVQTNDIAAVRSRLSAAGVVNPRRKGLARTSQGRGSVSAQTSFVSLEQAPISAAVASRTKDEIAHPTHVDHAPLDLPDPVLTGLDGEDPRQTIQALIHALSVRERERIDLLLASAARLGWSCAQLIESMKGTR